MSNIFTGLNYCSFQLLMWYRTCNSSNGSLVQMRYIASQNYQHFLSFQFAKFELKTKLWKFSLYRPIQLPSFNILSRQFKINEREKYNIKIINILSLSNLRNLNYKNQIMKIFFVPYKTSNSGKTNFHVL